MCFKRVWLSDVIKMGVVNATYSLVCVVGLDVSVLLMNWYVEETCCMVQLSCCVMFICHIDCQTLEWFDCPLLSL